MHVIYEAVPKNTFLYVLERQRRRSLANLYANANFEFVKSRFFAKWSRETKARRKKITEMEEKNACDTFLSSCHERANKLARDTKKDIFLLSSANSIMLKDKKGFVHCAHFVRVAHLHEYFSPFFSPLSFVQEKSCMCSSSYFYCEIYFFKPFLRLLQSSQSYYERNSIFNIK